MRNEAKKKKPLSLWLWSNRSEDYGLDELQVDQNSEDLESEALLEAENIEIIPDGYNSFQEFLLGGNPFESFRVAVDAAIYLTDVFQQMHDNEDYCQLFLPEQMLIEKETGRIIWNRDADTFSATGEEFCPSIMKYYAPEILRNQTLPDLYNNRFLLGVLIYQLLMNGQHPLEGKASVSPVMTREIGERIYKTQPSFLFEDPIGDNGPVPKIHKKSKMIWDSMPNHIKNMFLKCFGTEGLNNPEGRPSEQEWKLSLIQFQNSIMYCPCGNMINYMNNSESICTKCGRPQRIEFEIVLPEIKLPAIRGNRIYSSQLSQAEEKKYDTKIIARIVASQKDVRKLGIQNLTNKQWTAISTKGKAKVVEPEGIIPLKDGITFNYNGIDMFIARFNKITGEEK